MEGCDSCQKQLDRLHAHYKSKIEEMKVSFRNEFDSIYGNDNKYYHQLGRDFERFLISIEENKMLKQQWDRLMMTMKLIEDRTEDDNQ